MLLVLFQRFLFPVDYMNLRDLLICLYSFLICRYYFMGDNMCKNAVKLIMFGLLKFHQLSVLRVCCADNFKAAVNLFRDKQRPCCLKAATPTVILCLLRACWLSGSHPTAECFSPTLTVGHRLQSFSYVRSLSVF